MILYFVTSREAYTIEKYLAERGRAWQGRIKTLHYERLPHIRGFPTATYIFSDLDRLTKAQRLMVRNLSVELTRVVPELPILNDAASFIGRYDLLKLLYDSGINSYRAYRPYELSEDISYPVFLRIERDHMGPRSGLLKNREELDLAITEAIMAGVWPSNLMVVEFCDTSDKFGVFRKYSVTRFGDHYMSRHMVLGKDWVQKVPRKQHGISWPTEWLNEEKRFLETNPHLNQVRRVFELAKIDYGRIDYGVLDGRVQVWEINLNPSCMTPIEEQIPERLPFDEIIARRFDEAWALIDCKLPPTQPINVAVSYKTLHASSVSEWSIG